MSYKWIFMKRLENDFGNIREIWKGRFLINHVQVNFNETWEWILEILREHEKLIFGGWSPTSDCLHIDLRINLKILEEHEKLVFEIWESI